MLFTTRPDYSGDRSHDLLMGRARTPTFQTEFAHIMPTYHRIGISVCESTITVRHSATLGELSTHRRITCELIEDSERVRPRRSRIVKFYSVCLMHQIRPGACVTSQAPINRDHLARYRIGRARHQKHDEVGDVIG